MLRVIKWQAVSSDRQAGDDKVSLPEQDRFENEIVTKQGWRVVDTLTVDGHSRSHPNIVKMLDEHAAAGCFAYHKLLAHCDAHDFDVLLAYDDSRIGRSPGVYNTVVGSVLHAKARVYRVVGGWIDDTNEEFAAALGSIAATAGMRRLKQLRPAALERLVQRGLPQSSPPLTHRIVRDEAGRKLCLEVREDRRRLFDDLASLVLQRHGWLQVAYLLGQCGHINEATGRPYQAPTLRQTLLSPYTWGYSALNFQHHWGLWAFDESLAPPEGVKVYRHPIPPIPPVYEGEVAEALKAELRRRDALSGGRASADKAYLFGGLLVCAECGYRMQGARRVHDSGKAYMYYRCNAHAAKRMLATRCQARTSISEGVAQQQVAKWLARWVALSGSDIEGMLDIPRQDTLLSQVERLEAAINASKTKVDTMIRRQASASQTVQEQYAAQIEAEAARLDGLYTQLAQLRVASESRLEIDARQQTWLQLRELNLDRFWTQDSTEVNAWLLRVFGSYRFVVSHGKIVDCRRFT